ncbi:MAG: hypothetical protein R6U88_05520 [Candidatus Bipolaricaulota bacterium]
MNGAGGIWTVVLVALVGLGAWLVALGWPFLQTLSPETPPGQLLQIAETLAGAEDLDARVTLEGQGDEGVEVRLRYIAHPAIRIDVLKPEELDGEVYTLREIVDGWMLVHYRPREGAGVEIPVEGADWLTDLLDVGRLRAGLQLGRISVASPEVGVLDIRGPPGPYHRLVIEKAPEDEDVLLTKVDVYSLKEEREVRIARAHILELELNQGIEFRELLSLPAPPRRWFGG